MMVYKKSDYVFLSFCEADFEYVGAMIRILKESGVSVINAKMAG